MTATKPQPQDTVPPGYKKTEVGVIPEDWGCTTVGTEFDIQLGKMLDAEKNTGTPKPFLGNRAVQWGRIDISDIGIVPLTPSDVHRFRLKDGDLLVCEGGEVGRAAIWKAQLDECYYQKALHRLRPKRCYSVPFMLNVLQQLASSGRFSDYVTQTSIAHLPKDKFETIPILRPTRAEQEAIAGALSDADAWIESLEKLIAKKRAIKQGTQQALLTPPGQPGHRRLPGFEGKWEVKRVGEMGEIITGGTPRTGEAQFWGGKYPWVTPTDISSVRDMTTSERRLTRPGMNSIRALPANTVLVTCIASIGKNAILRKPGACNQQINAIIPNDISCLEFLYYMFESSKQYLVSNSGITATRILSKVTFSELAFHVPDCPEQSAIAVVLSDMDAEIEALEAKLAKARQIKQGMMQELLTGRIRLVKPKGGH